MTNTDRSIAESLARQGVKSSSNSPFRQEIKAELKKIEEEKQASVINRFSGASNVEQAKRISSEKIETKKKRSRTATVQQTTTRTTPSVPLETVTSNLRKPVMQSIRETQNPDRAIAESLARQGVQSSANSPYRQEIKAELKKIEEDRKKKSSVPTNTFTETNKAKGFLNRASQVLSREQNILQAQIDKRSAQQKESLLIGGKSFVLGVAEGTVNTAILVRDIAVKSSEANVRNFLNPVKPIKQAVQGVKNIVENPSIVSSTASAVVVISGNTLEGVGSSLASNPARFLGEAVSPSVGGSIITKAVRGAKNVFVKTGSTFVPPEKVFAKSVLEGKENLPTVSSTAESLSRFQQAGNIVQTSSPAKIKGTTAGVGRKGGIIEDSGIYVTPAGEGSPYFLRLEGTPDVDYSSFSINPLSNGLFNVPTVTRAKASAVEKLPRDVVDVAGFSAIKNFQEGQAGSGKVFITKRSELGQGELTKKTFEAPDDLQIDNFNIKKGSKLTEAGTSEIEAVIPFGQEFIYTPTTTIGKLKGFDYYTVYKGTPVAIRDTVLKVDDKIKPSSLVSTPSSSLVSQNKILSEASYLNTASSKKLVVSPFSFSFSNSLNSLGGGSSDVSAVSSFSGGSISSSGVSTVVSGSSGVSAVSSFSGGSSGGSSSPKGSSSGGSSGGSSGVSAVSSFSGGSSVSPSSPKGGSSGYSRIFQSSRPSKPFRYSSSLINKPLSSLIKKEGSDEDSLFDLFVGKEQNKFFTVKRGLTLKEAVATGKELTSTTLSASFQIKTRSGKIVDPKSIKEKVGNDFEVSKRGDRVVEKRSKRLSTSKEQKQIQRFAKKNFTVKQRVQLFEMVNKKKIPLRKARGFL